MCSRSRLILGKVSLNWHHQVFYSEQTIRLGEMPAIQNKLDAIPWGEAEYVVADSLIVAAPERDY